MGGPAGDWRPHDEVGASAIARTLTVIDGRWSTLVVHELLVGPKRFGQLRDALPGISPKTLTDRLRALEAHGVLTRTAYAEIPPRVEYELTEHGRTLEAVLQAMADWGTRADATPPTPSALGSMLKRHSSRDRYGNPG